MTVGEGGITADDVLVHDETNRALAHMLVALEPPAFPVALGVIYCSPVPSFEAEVYAQASAASAGRGAPDLAELFVIEDGRLMESGTHGELLGRAGGKYRRLYEMQVELA